MNKAEFIDELRFCLQDLPADDLGRIVEYYSEMIDDATENGSTEEDAVAALGSFEGIVQEARSTYASDTPPAKKNVKTADPWLIVLMIAGVPVWLPLLIAAAAVAFSLYITLIALCLPVYALTAGLFLGSFPLMGAGAGVTFSGHIPEGLLIFGTALVLLGLSGFLLIASVYITKGITALTRWLFKAVASLFGGKGRKA